MENSVEGQHMISEHTSKTSILSPKQTTLIGCWNVRTIYETGRLSQVIQEMLKCNIGILGISECRWIGSGKITHNIGCVVCYSERHDRLHYGEVAIILIKSVSQSLLEWRDINHRINYVRLKASYGYICQ